MTRSFRIALALLTTLVSITLATAADFHDYSKLGKAQIERILPTETRTVIDLSGPWQVIEDGEAVGTMDLPSSRKNDGMITLRRSVKIDKNTLHSRAWSIQFLGVSHEVDLKVNGRPVMRYPGGSAPFVARIPDRILTPGSNDIELTISKGGDLGNIVHRFAPYAQQQPLGVFRELFLVGTPQVWTSEVITSTAFSSGQSMATVVATAVINGANVDRLAGTVTSDEAMRQGSISVGVEATIRRIATNEVVARTGPQTASIERARSTKMRFDLSVANPSLWTPTNPTLYEIEIRITHNGSLVDTYSSSIGFRSIRVGTTEGGRRLFLNDSLIFISGASYVEEYPRQGATLSYRQMEYDVAMLKTLGVNVVRFNHHAPHPYLLHLCDRYGIMTLIELDAVGVPKGLINEEEISAQLRNRADMLAGYVGNHPSVIGCGLSDLLEEGAEQTSTLHAELAKIFRTRSTGLIYKVIAGGQVSKTSEGGFDLIVLRMNTQRDRLRMDAILEEAERVIRTAAVLTSIGTVVSPANMNGFSDPLSNEAQAIVIRDGYQSAKFHGLAGCLVETFNDHSLELPTMLVDHYDPFVRTSGMVDVWRQPRVSYAMYKSLINEEKEPLLQAREYDNSTPLTFIATGLVLALILAFLVNRSRRFREYFARSIIRPYNFYADIRDQRILSVVQTMLLGLVVASSIGLVLAALLYFLRIDPAVEYLLHLLTPSTTVYELVRFIAWRPALAVIVMSLLVFAVLILSSTLLRIGGMFIKGRILYRDTLTIVVWSAVPLLALLPIGVGLYQVLSTDAMSSWIPLIVIASAAWTVFRILRATSVVFDAPALIVYGLGVGVILLFLGVAIGLWAYLYSGFEFLQYYRAVISV